MFVASNYMDISSVTHNVPAF